MTEFEIFTMPNGIRCIHKQVKSAVAHVGITIGSGTRDESPSQHGVAHMVEHMLFKGTERRRAYHINNLLESVGGELNAYTSKEETTIHATILKQDYTKALDLISDIIFNSTFPAKEIEKEKDVIIDEINSYKDSPSEMIFDEFEELLFGGSTLGRNILGCKRDMQSIGQGCLREFIGRTYNTNHMVLFSIGNISPTRFRMLCEKYVGGYAENNRAFSRQAPTIQNAFRIEKNKRTFQTHCVIGTQAYSLDQNKRIPLALLVNIIGGSASNSTLNTLLREKNGLTYNIEAGYTAYQDAGIATIYFGCDRDKIDRSLELIMNELRRIANSGLSSLQLQRAKRQFIGQFAVSSESAENYIIGAAKSLLVYNEVDSTTRINEKIMAITPADITKVAAEVLLPEKLSILIYK